MTDKDTVELNDDTDIVKLYKYYRWNIQAFAEDFLPHILTSKSPDFHSEIYNNLEKEEYLIICASRGFGKSIIVDLVFTIHAILFKYKKGVRIISASEKLAIKAVSLIKNELETNDKLILFFGDQKGKKWAETEIQLKNGARVAGAGVGGQIRGFRADLMILDDIETEDSVSSSEQRKKIDTWIKKSCLPTMIPKVGQFVWIGTLISPLALLMQEIENKRDGIKTLLFRAYKTLEQVKGNETWPDLFDHDELQKRKLRGGSHAFSTEYMNDPKSSETAAIKSEHIRYWDNDALPTVYNDIITVDPAYSDDQKADYKTCTVIRLDTKGNRYLVEVLRTHNPQGEFMDEVLNMYLRTNGKCIAIGVPGGREIDFYRSLQTKAAARRLYPPFVELKNVYSTTTGVSIRNKTRRITASLQPLFEQGKYFIGRDHQQAREELLTIGSSVHDDVVDCLSYGEELIQGKNLIVDEHSMEIEGRYGGEVEQVTMRSNDYGISY